MGPLKAGAVTVIWGGVLILHSAQSMAALWGGFFVIALGAGLIPPKKGSRK